MDKAISSAKKQINKFLVISVLLSISFGQLTRIDYHPLPAFYIHDILVAIFIILNLNLSSKVAKDSLLKPFLVFFSLNLITHLRVGTYLYPGFLYLIRLSMYFGFYLYLRNLKISFRKTAAILLAGTITLVIAALQYFLLPDTRYLYYLGWDDHLNRVIFPHLDPTYTSIALTLFSLHALQHKRIFLIALTFPFILLTYARSTFISILSLLFIKFQKLIPIALISLFILLIIPKGFGEGTNLFRVYSIRDRITHDTAVLNLGLDYPVFGVGYNNVGLYLFSGFDRLNHATSANNSLIQLFASSGIVGMITFIYLCIKIYKQSSYKPSLLFLAISSLFNNTLFYPFFLLWIFILDGLKVSKRDLE